MTIDEEVYHGLHKLVGPRHISRFLNDLARSHVVPDALEDGYSAMAADEDREREAMTWIEATVTDVADGPS